MKPGVITQFRVKGEREMPALFNSNNALIKPGKNMKRRPRPGDNRGTDEDGMEGSSLKACYRETGFKGFLLPPECIPVHFHIHEAEGMDAVICNVGGHQHHTSAGGKNAAVELPDRFK